MSGTRCESYSLGIEPANTLSAWGLPMVRPPFQASSAASRSLDGGDVDLSHRHHRIERALRRSRVRIADRLRQRDRRDLPGDAPPVLAPSALALLAAVADDRVPVAIGFSLV